MQAYTARLAHRDNGLSAEQFRAADINEDGFIGVEDAQYILLYYVSAELIHKPKTWYEVMHR